MAKITWGFDISAKDCGVDQNVETGYTDGFAVSPKQHPISIIPRSEKHRKVFEADLLAQKNVFAKYED
jgi:hypothetical protein